MPEIAQFLRVPTHSERAAAREAFATAVARFIDEVTSRTASRNEELPEAVEAEQGVSAPDGDAPMTIWARHVRSGAPAEVRANAWLLVGWCARCVRHEEPALVWMGGVAALVVGAAIAYPAVRGLVALLMSSAAA